ncbi:zinc finger protein JAGGED [Dorcoceras hygrometricum]|uniref:Zinc finger protein JAGGED n=1 Tax=Dorcoceras hygrometricum TaxID=472368 RepID=A0A2Z7CZX6_9LAMI|nr:zinc finger protein JAGGED [Dorcoceras hygrometricum]
MILQAEFSPAEEHEVTKFFAMICVRVDNKYIYWRSEGNPLDLNNLPEDYGKQASEDSSSSAERETETLNKARQLVFSNDLAPTTHHLGYVSSNGQAIPHGGYHHQATNMSDPSMPFRSMCPTRLFPLSSPLMPPPMYASPPRLLPFPSGAPINEYYVGHVLSNPTLNEGNYTCIGAPVGGVRDMTLQNQEEGLNWGRR